MTRPTLLNYVTCPYGKPGDWMAGYHTGIDFRASVGTPIFATKRGKIVWAGSGGSYGSAYGNYVVVQTKHYTRTIQHMYAHLSKVNVSKGQNVKTGQMLGLSGETGNTFGPHMHYEERVAPFNYWAHKSPVLPQWQPKKKYLDIVLKRIGVKK